MRHAHLPKGPTSSSYICIITSPKGTNTIISYLHRYFAQRDQHHHLISASLLRPKGPTPSSHICIVTSPKGTNTIISYLHRYFAQRDHQHNHLISASLLRPKGPTPSSHICIITSPKGTNTIISYLHRYFAQRDQHHHLISASLLRPKGPTPSSHICTITSRLRHLWTRSSRVSQIIAGKCFIILTTRLCFMCFGQLFGYSGRNDSRRCCFASGRIRTTA